MNVQTDEIFVRLTKKAKIFAYNCVGSTAIEYGLITAFVSVSIIAVLQYIGVEVVKPFQMINEVLSALF